MNKKYTPPKETKQDKSRQMIKAILSEFPGGSVGGELLDHIVTPSLQTRREKWRIEISKGLSKLERENILTTENISGLTKNDIFIDTVLQATTIAIKNSQKEKLEYLKNSILNSAIDKVSLDENYQNIFLNLIDEFTIYHIQILILFNTSPKTNIKGRRRDSLRAWDIVIEKFPDLKNHFLLVNKIFKDLMSHQLINDINVNSIFVVEKKTTGLGEKFIEFITSYEEKNKK